MNNTFLVDKETRTVIITREFEAPQALVWRTWTEAELLDRWWAPSPFKSVTKAMNFVEGGRRFYAMVTPEGAENWALQRYTSINPKTDFSFYNTFADEDENPVLPGSEWTMTFSEEHGITTVHISIYNESLERMEKMIEMGFKEGFTATLIQLEQLIKQHQQ